MIQITEKEATQIQYITERTQTIDSLIERALNKEFPVRNKELLKEILDELVKMRRLQDRGWEKMGKRYGFDHRKPHFVNWNTMEIKEQ
jgi:CXXX repeat modification system protein